MLWARLWARFGRLAVPRVAFPDDAQPFERQKIVDILNVLRSCPDHRPQAAGRDHVRFLAHFPEQQFENAVDQPEISVVKAGLQAAHSVRSDHARRFANVHARQPCSAFEQRIGRNADAGANHSAEIFAFRRNAIESRRRAEITTTHGPPNFSNAATALTMRSAPTSAGLS